MSRWEIWIWLSLGTAANYWSSDWPPEKIINFVGSYGIALFSHWFSLPLTRFIRRGFGLGDR